MEHDGTHSQKLPDTSIQLEYAWNPDKRLLTTCEPRNQLMKYWDRHLDAMEITMQQPCSNFQYPYGATISINFRPSPFENQVGARPKSLLRKHGRATQRSRVSVTTHFDTFCSLAQLSIYPPVTKHSYGKSPFSMGKSTAHHHFQ